MKRHIPIFALLLSSVSFAQEPTLPTEPSKPLPTIQETRNIDTVIREKVQKKITQIPALKNQAVSAASYNQVVTLEGSVETKAQERAAINAAKSIRGVKEVRSQLTITYKSPEDKK